MPEIPRELPDGIVIASVPEVGGFIGRNCLIVNEKAEARVFAHDRAAAQYVKRSDISMIVKTGRPDEEFEEFEEDYTDLGGDA